MSESQVIARKFRPQSFDQVIGQEAITRTLMNSIKSGRLHHAYLFTGARGVGKTTTARILAKALNCAKQITTQPCDECASCLDIAASRSIDVQEIDAASHTQVENIREVIINSIGIAPARDRHKIFIIDEVHQLSGHSFNALLKTIEEPPPRVVFILATTEQAKVPDTILSRCQIFEFRTITLKKIIEQLRFIADKEGVKISDAALLAIARAGEGSMRDAESALDQVISFAGSEISDDDVSAALGLVDIETLNKTLQSIAEQDPGRIVRIVEEVVSRGYDLRTFCREMMVHIRALLVVKIAGFDSELVQLPESEAAALEQLSGLFSEQDLLRFFSILTKTEQDIRNSSQPRFQLEIGLVKMAQAQRLVLIEGALSRLEAIESRLGGGSAATSRREAAPSSNTPVARQVGQASSRPASSARAPVRPGGEQTKPEPRGQVANSPADVPVFGTPTGAAAGAAPATPNVGVKASQTPEPPPPQDETFETVMELPSKSHAPGPAAKSDGDPVHRIKAALEDKRKRMIVAALDQGIVSIDGDHLLVIYAPERSKHKSDIESRDKRIAIEDACEQVLGRRLT
ncbi:MAG: DNA polymerase III subunit gamma/tau, partial [Blastocatellia bacterium]